MPNFIHEKFGLTMRQGLEYNQLKINCQNQIKQIGRKTVGFRRQNLQNVTKKGVGVSLTTCGRKLEVS